MIKQELIESLITKYQPIGDDGRNYIMLCNSIFGGYAKKEFDGFINVSLSSFLNEGKQFELTDSFIEDKISQWDKKASIALETERYENYLEYSKYALRFKALQRSLK